MSLFSEQARSRIADKQLSIAAVHGQHLDALVRVWSQIFRRLAPRFTALVTRPGRRLCAPKADALDGAAGRARAKISGIPCPHTNSTLASLAVASPAGADPTGIALVESLTGNPSGVEVMDYVRAGQIIRLGPHQTIVLSYMASCVRETIRAGPSPLGRSGAKCNLDMSEGSRVTAIVAGWSPRAKRPTGGGVFAAQRTDRVKPKPFHLLLGRRVTPDSQASAVGELGCFDMGLIGYINRELCPALTQQELHNILVIHRANGLRWHADRLEAAGNGALRQQRAQRHVRALAMSSEPPLRKCRSYLGE